MAKKICIILIILISGCVGNNTEINVKFHGKDLKFIFNDKKTILDYEILDMEGYDNQYGSYKKILEGRNINAELSEVSISKESNVGLRNNHAYIFSSGISGGKNQPGVVLKSIVFCFKNNNVITQYKSESDSDFIKKCKGLI